jgi:poly-gamma-glutamate capsule biosynthesis protein CapA/YwtB (metallophosphatase superfamily)
VARPAAAGGSAGASVSLELTFLGDIMAHSPIQATQAPSSIYAAIATTLAQDHLTFANLEFPVDDRAPAASYPHFNAHSPFVHAAVDAGIDVLSLANNHAFDRGLAGVVGTRAALAALARDRSGRLYVSGTRTQVGAPFEPTLITVAGWRIGYLAVSEHANQIAGARSFVDIVDYHVPAEVDALLSRVRSIAPAYDLLVLSYHGGVELAVEPQRRKSEFFLNLIEAGVDIVHGHHPHVLQRLVIAERDGDRKLIMPSTGNLISGMSLPVAAGSPLERRAAAGDSALFRVVVSRGRSGATIADVTQLLVTNYRDAKGRMVIGWLADVAARAQPPWRSYFAARLEHIRAQFCPPCESPPGSYPRQR